MDTPTHSTTATGRTRPSRPWRIAKVVIRVLVPVGVVILVWGELTRLDWPQVYGEMAEANFLLLVAAGVVVAANVAAMGLYDAVSFPSAPRLGFARRWRLGALCFAWSNFLTIGPIGGPALRFFVYGRFGLSPAQVARGLGVQYCGFAGGLAGWLIATALPLTGLGGLAIRAGIALSVAVTLAAVLRRAAVAFLERRGRRQPADDDALVQLRRVRAVPLGVVGFLDWGCSLAAFWIVARSAGMLLEVGDAARTFLGGHLIGMISMLPGGLGSADAAWLFGLTNGSQPGGYEPDVAAAGILLFRVVFYLLPWAVAAAITLTIAGPKLDEAAQWRPRVLASVAGVYAAIMLTAQALPSGHAWPIPPALPPTIALTQVTHVAALLAAAGVACQIPGLMAGTRQAWANTLRLVAIGLVAHALKADDLQEVLVSALVLVLGFAARRSFEPSSTWRAPWWIPGATLAICAALYWVVGIQAFPRRVVDAGDLFAFGTSEGAGRFVRGGALLVLLTPAALAWGLFRRRGEALQPRS
jgi:phosphatidylglycerol lysyltransferase